MNQYEKIKAVADPLRKLSAKHNIAFVTATQPPRSEGSFVPRRLPKDPDAIDIVIIDHMSLIKP